MPNLPVDFNIEIKADVTKPVNDITAAIVSAANFIEEYWVHRLKRWEELCANQIQYWRAKNIERLKDKWLAMRI